MAADIFFDAKGTEYFASRRAGQVAPNFLLPFLLPFGHNFRFRN